MSAPQKQLLPPNSSLLTLKTKELILSYVYIDVLTAVLLG